MKFLSIQPIVPSGNDFEKSKQLFIELGFRMTWCDSDYADFVSDECKFVLQRLDKSEFAQNYMLIVDIDSAAEFRSMALNKNLAEKFGIRISEVNQQPYGKEVNIIDIAGVCWHFVER
jgi:hypothetical protein